VLTRRYLSPVDLGVPVNTRLAAGCRVIAFALAGFVVATCLSARS